MLNDLQIEQLARHFGGTSTREDDREIFRWCKADSANDKLYAELREVWKLTGKIPTDFQPDVKAAWNSVSTKIDSYKNEFDTSKGSSKLKYYVSRIAAVFVVGIALYFMFVLNNNNSEILLTEKLVAQNDVTDVILSDGSKVWLNSNSTLRYSKEFDGGNRLVELEGEAYFEVAKNPDKPFIIKTASSVTEVLGTSFNYSAYKVDEKDVLTVNSGRVKFSESENDKNQVILIMGEKAEFNVLDKKITKSVNENLNYLSWKTGKLVFIDETFDEVAKDLSKYYKRSFVIKTESLKSTKLTVTFNNQNLEDVLKVLELTLNVTCSAKSEKIIIN